MTTYADKDSPTPLPSAGAAGPTPNQHRAMHALWRQTGITTRTARLTLTAAAVDRPITSSADLTPAEADTLIGYMRGLHRAGTLAATAAAFLASREVPQ